MRHYMSSFMAVYKGTGHSPIRKLVVWFFRNASQWSIFTIGRQGTVYCSLNSIVNPWKKKQEMFQKHICSHGAKFTIEAKPVEASKQGIKINKVDNTLGSKEWFDLNFWTCDLKINSDHLLIGRNPCTKFHIDQVKGSKYIERTTLWAQKTGLTLAFEHVTWESIVIIHLLRATPATSLVLIKWRGQKILSGQHTGHKRVVWPWPLNMWPENQEGSFTYRGQPLHQVWYWSSEGAKRYWGNNTLGSRVVWPWPWIMWPENQ